MESLLDDLKDELNRTEKNIKIIRHLIELKKHNDCDVLDIFEEFQNFNDFTLDDLIYNLYTDKRIKDITLEKRIQEYEKQQKIIKPFLPFILLYSLYLL